MLAESITYYLEPAMSYILLGVIMYQVLEINVSFGGCGCSLLDENHTILQVAYTFDAGPNAVLIARNRKVAANLLQRLLFHFPPSDGVDLNRYDNQESNIEIQLRRNLLKSQCLVKGKIVCFSDTSYSSVPPVTSSVTRKS